MWLKWLPWKYVIRRAARAHGFIDPISILTRLQQFAQPSEVAEPIELLRAGAVFHARGLVNVRAIQHNLDWVWPYWVSRQFDPLDDSFLPRAYSLTHINLTHRNWTAVGVPNCNALPIIDPRGLVTPLFDGWSIDGWILNYDGSSLLPSRMQQIDQQLEILPDGIAVVTVAAHDEMTLRSRVQVRIEGNRPICQIEFEASSDRAGFFAVALRPYNPEGISFVHDAVFRTDRKGWKVNESADVIFDTPADRNVTSDYRLGDVFLRILKREETTSIKCDLGLATATALFRIEAGQKRAIRVDVPLEADEQSAPLFAPGFAPQRWSDVLNRVARLSVPDEKFQFLYDAAVRTLVLHSPADVYPGPYTYKRFWFRDAAFMLNAMLCVGLVDRVESVLNRFPAKQSLSGFFHSQDGEWDSNGETLWIMHRFCQLSGRPPRQEWLTSVLKAAEWIHGKRLPDDLDALHAGLMPAGFSAEHLGTNDHFYWDDFWSVAGLEAAAAMADSWHENEGAATFRDEAKAFMAAIERSLERSAPRRIRHGLPASPYRRMDSGSIGSIVVSYPLQLWPADDQRVLDTVNLLMQISFVKGAFFQNMIHSGINAYLTLHVAQVLLRAGDARFFSLVRAIADAASPTGQWPEAIHPRTTGGCMGDGQHAWAAAEWVLMMRNMFVREEGNRLILASGIVKEWTDKQQPITFGPAPTSFGDISVRIVPRGDEIEVSWEVEWRGTVPEVEICLPGNEPVRVEDGSVRSMTLRQTVTVPE